MLRLTRHKVTARVAICAAAAIVLLATGTPSISTSRAAQPEGQGILRALHNALVHTNQIPDAVEVVRLGIAADLAWLTPNKCTRTSICDPGHCVPAAFEHWDFIAGGEVARCTCSR